MAFATKYRLEIKDFHEYDWKVDIEEDGFGGSVTDLLGSSDPIRIEWENNSDDLFDPLQPSKCFITVKSLTDFAYTDLYSVQDLQFRVKVYQNSTLFWMGYVVTRDYKEPYEYTPYDVTISAWCGLEYLSLVPYKDGETYYNGRSTISQVIFNVLGKLSNSDAEGTDQFWEYVNVYETSHYTTPADSPFAQTQIDNDVFYDLYCDEVLRRICETFGARVIMANGVFRFYRPKELADASVMGRWFTDPGTYSSGSYSTTQYINRTIHSSDRLQVPGGELMVQSPAKKVTINQDYGFKQSWVDNYEVKSDTYHGTPDFTYDFWTRSGVWGLNHISELIPGETDGLCLTSDAAPTAGDYIYQSFGPSAVASAGDVFIFGFDYLFYNNDTDGDPAIIILQVQNDTDGTYLYEVNDARCDWTAAASYITVTNTNLPLGKTGWDTYERSIVGLTSAGTITVRVYKCQTVAGVYAGVKNVLFYCTNDKITLKTKKRKFFQRIKIGGGYGGEWQIGLKNKYFSVKTIKDVEEITGNSYVQSNAINGNELEYDFLLGDVDDVGIDNVLEQFKGSLATYDYVGLTSEYSTTWSTRGNSESMPLRELICKEIANEYSRPKELIQMPIIDEGTGASAINIIGHFEDELKTYSGNNRKFVFNRGSFGVRFRKWEIDLMEVLNLGTTGGEDPGDPTNPESYPGSGWGVLYNWYVTNFSANLIPGWHVPSIAEWDALRDYVDGGPIAPWANSSGQKLKETGTTHWASPNTYADNAFGFNGRGTGSRDNTGAFGGRTATCQMWSSEEGTSALYGYVKALNYDRADLTYDNTVSKKYGLPIRLIKDDSTDPGTVTDYEGHVYNTVKIGDQVWLSTNLATLYYSFGDPIPMITDSASWIADAAGACCFYNNDIALINSISAITGAVHNTTISVSFNATCTVSYSAEIYWQVRNSSDLVRSSGNETVSISSGTANYTISVDIPNETGTQYYIMIGKSSSPTLESNRFSIT